MMRRAIGFFIVLVSMTFAQQIGQNKSPDSETPTFSTGAQLVVETVTVTGKDGEPVEGLTAKDFTITENNTPQTIRVFEAQHVADTPAPPPSKAPNIHIYDRLTRVKITPESAEKPKYQNRRLLALYFDMTAMQMADQMRALTAAKNFVQTQMQAADLVAILRYQGGAVEVLQDFTDDRDRILSILETIAVGEGQGFDESGNDAGVADTGAAFGQDDSEFNIFNTDR